jgi:predicted nucleic acid-binding protein
MRGSIDTNIVGHLYRSNCTFLITNLFNEILVDEIVVREARNRCGDIYEDFDKDIKDSSTIFMLQTQGTLKAASLYSLYEIQMRDMDALFFPKDEGEKRAIALAKATGAYFLLTDDEKHMEGPYYYLDKGIIKDMEALAFWDLIYLNILLGHQSHEQGKDTFDLIAKDGYFPPYQGNFESKMKTSIRRLKDKEWFNDWCDQKSITKSQTAQLLRDIKSNDW